MFSSLYFVVDNGDLGEYVKEESLKDERDKVEEDDNDDDKEEDEEEVEQDG